MPHIENKTPFAADVFGAFDPAARELLILVVRATYEVHSGVAQIAEQQLPISAVDIHLGDPALTSVVYPSDFAYAKGAVDVLVTGHAWAPMGRRIETSSVGLGIGTYRKTLVVRGDRFWTLGALGQRPSAPKPFDCMPLIYERAFGGTLNEKSGSKVDPRNPVGVGFRGAKSADPTVSTELPNIEYPSHRRRSINDQLHPAGFGAIAPGWQPRPAYAGTYDTTWLEEHAPLLPLDFNTRFFQVAPEDQQLNHVKTGDMIKVAGMTPNGHWAFAYPETRLDASLVYADRLVSIVLGPDTIHLEPDVGRLHLTSRYAIPILRNRGPLEEIVLGGGPSRGWLRAKRSGKAYFENKGLGEWA